LVPGNADEALTAAEGSSTTRARWMVMRDSARLHAVVPHSGGGQQEHAGQQRRHDLRPQQSSMMVSASGLLASLLHVGPTCK